MSANLNLGSYLNLLKADGTLVELGMPEHDMAVPPFPLASMRRSLSGSMIGGIPETQEMLDFCAEHGVTPEIEVIEADYVNEAYERCWPATCATASSSTPQLCEVSGSSSSLTPASGHPAAASVAATRLMFSGPAS